jgi:small GTP-binding protein
MDTRYYKICIVGDCDVGKSAIATRYVHDLFDEIPSSTIGATYLCKKTKYKNSEVQLQLWDTAGQERYRTITPLYYRNAACVILVIDQTILSSINNTLYWINSIRQHVENMPIFMAINKSDMHCKLPDHFIQTILQEFPDIKYTSVSAKTNDGIENFFLDIIEILYNDYNTPITNTNPVLLNDDSKQKKWFNNCSIL